MTQTRQATAAWQRKDNVRAIEIQTNDAGLGWRPAAVHHHDVERASDLRRRHARSMVETLLDLAVALPPNERALINAVYRDGKTALELSPLVGDSPPVIRRRVRAIVKRVMTPEFRYVAAVTGALRGPVDIRRLAGDDVPTIASKWPRMRRRVAELCVLEGHSQRAVADKLATSVHTIRRHMNAVAALVEEANT